MATRRCILRQFLLRPDLRVNQAILYCLGFAAQSFGVELHWFYAASNHTHGGYTDHFGNLPRFHHCFHQLVAKVINARRGRWSSFWADEQTSIVECIEPEDAFAEMIYSVTNPAKDQLVERAQLWPGINSLTSQLLGNEIRVRRPDWFFDSDGDMPKEVTLRFTRPPGFAQLSQSQWVAKVQAAVARIEANAAQERAERGTRVLGRKAILAQCPSDSPKSNELRRRPKPRVACKNKGRRIETFARNKLWLDQYKSALRAYRAGRKRTPFPHGSWQLAQDTHVRCAAGPGPLGVPYAVVLRGNA